MQLRLTAGLGLLVALWMGSVTPGVPDAAATPAVTASLAPAALDRAPLLRSPQPGTTLGAIGPVTFDWDLPPGATQYQLQAAPATGDGPGVNLIRNAARTYTLAAPELGRGPYILLPDLTYAWRVRVTGAAASVSESDPAWAPWSETWTFRTPPAAVRFEPAAPADGASVSTATTALQWRSSDPALFYFEVQVSRDPRFGEGAAAFAPVWWNLAHGGASVPLNSWTTPPLAPGATYAWRVRPRVQGDGAPSPWGPAWSFTTAAEFPPTPTVPPAPAPSPAATPAAPPTAIPTQAPLLAFVSTRNDHPEIYTMRLDGSEVRRLTNDPLGSDQPAWSPDGRKLAVMSPRYGKREIFVMNADGSEQTLLTATGGVNELPVWFPAGLRLAFVSTRDGPAGLYAVNPDGVMLQRLTLGGVEREAPAFWPNGTRLAFASNRDGYRAIFTMSGDGGGETKLTNTKKDDPKDLQANNIQPAWSPDGGKIAFVSDRDLLQQVYIMDTDGNNQTRLTSNLGANHSPAWSPDGKRIAFVSTRDGPPHIYLINPDGSGQVRLTDGPGGDTRPRWSPDGSLIAFESLRDGNQEVYVMSASGSGQRNITQNGASDYGMAWAPLGR